MTKKQRKQRYAVCLSNDGYLASLERRKIYRVVSDAAAERRGLLRVVDESGVDYLFPVPVRHRLTAAGGGARVLIEGVSIDLSAAT
jgi:hypothetical protein